MIKGIKIFFLLSFFATLSDCSNEIDHKEDTVVVSEKGLLAAIAEFNTAFQNGNVEVLESMITQSYMHTNGNSKPIGKEAWINYLRKRAGLIKNGKLKVESYKMSEVEVEMYGNTAIVSARIDVESRREEELSVNQYRVTNIWVNESGNWKRAGFHDGKIE